MKGVLVKGGALALPASPYVQDTLSARKGLTATSHGSYDIPHELSYIPIDFIGFAKRGAK